ncbi:hypothetical protein BUE80_DR007268 [Diplocarpon rosae]|nr:hypothetical protein BUE80_DR007268 [Diplocarpon rosae]
MSLEEKLDKIRSPKLQSQQQTRIVLASLEDILRDQKTAHTPTGYFAGLLALLGKATCSAGVNKELATSVVYLLDVVTPYAPQPLLQSKFSQILANLAPALILPEADAPLLRPSIGCLESLLIAQDSAAWELSLAQIGPRRAVAGLLNLAVDHRPKIRKRAQDAITKVLKSPPPSVSLDHPAADMCAETALKSLSDLAAQSSQTKKQKKSETTEHEPALIHALQLVKTVASASGGWPSKKIEALCEVLLNISKSKNEYMTMAAFDVFEIIFQGMSDELSSSKLPRLLEVIQELRPSQNDSQLLPPWIAVLSRGYDVSSQIEPDETFQKLPELFSMISGFLASSSHNIRVSASECLVSFMANCVPNSVLLDPSIFDEKVLEKLAKAAMELLSVKYQAAWMETFNVMGAMFDGLRWRSDPILADVVRTIGELRGNESFTGKVEANEIIGKAIRAMGPEAVLKILPLNLAKTKAGQPGRAWMLPILRDFVSNTSLQHFKNEFVPLSEVMFGKVLAHGGAEKTMEIKLFETVVHQTWAILPGYCDLPLDLTEAFDQSFAELLANLLYQQSDLRTDICKGLQLLVDSNQAVAAIKTEEDLVLQSRVSKATAQKNLDHLSIFASNMLSVLFNVYSKTLPHHRGYILRCINSYLSIIPSAELMKTFESVTKMLEDSLTEAGSQTQAEKQKQKQQNAAEKMPPTSHTLMDLVITISVYLPRDSFNGKVSHMPDDTPPVPATLEEYFTMVGAGLGGSTPHMNSACITALTRILYHFRESLQAETIAGLVETMDLFLTSNNREIVRSVLGFVKVCIISLPTDMMRPRLQTLVPNLMVWSHEHKAHFKAKVKHIIERMIRRFGVDIVNKYYEDEPLDLLDRKALANISSTKPLKQKAVVRTKAKMDLDGKLLLGGDSSDDDDDAMILDTPGEKVEEDEGGVGAYVKALKGRDAVQRGRGGRLKFSNKRDTADGDEMDVDEDDIKAVKKQIGGNARDGIRGRGRGGDSGRGDRGKGGRGGIANGRRGLGEEKRHGDGGRGVSRGGGRGVRGGDRVMKSPRGRVRR